MINRRIARASSADMMELACDIGPAPRQWGAVFLFEAGTTLDLDSVRSAVAARIVGVRRLRQRLMRTPWGCGRPIWVDDPDFDLANHVRTAACPSPGDRTAVLAAAAELLARPLSLRHPAWEVTLLAGETGSRTALVVVMHHVLADGMGGLAILAHLVDGGPTITSEEPGRPAPGRAELARDAALSGLRTLGRLRTMPGTVRAAVAELRSGATPPAAGCSLNRASGLHRRLTSIRGDLATVRTVAHSHAASVNDVMLTVIATALNDLLAHRGEHIDPIVVSVPVSTRAQQAAATLGNQVGVMPVAIPTGLAADACLTAVATSTRDRRSRTRGASTTLLAPAFRALAGLHLLRWAVNRQRLVHTVVTNLRGPDASVSFLGAAVDEIVPLGLLAGNIAVAFAVFSYAGSITITVTVDPDIVPDLEVLAHSLERELTDLDQIQSPVAAS
jgi:WS/DGAT/MGAT family acyltransferase